MFEISPIMFNYYYVAILRPTLLFEDHVFVYSPLPEGKGDIANKQKWKWQWCNTANDEVFSEKTENLLKKTWKRENSKIIMWHWFAKHDQMPIDFQWYKNIKLYFKRSINFSWKNAII